MRRPSYALPPAVPTRDRSTPVRAPRRRPPPRGVVGLPGLMLPAEGSVAPVHYAGDLADNRAPTERRGFCPDFLQLPPGHEPTQPTALDGAQRLVEVVEWRAGGERGDDRLDLQRVPQVTGDLAGLDDQARVPGVPAAAQVVHDQVQLVGVLRQGYHVLGAQPQHQLRPGVELAEVVLVAGVDELRQALGAAEQVQPAGPAEEDRYLLRLGGGHFLFLFLFFVFFLFFLFVEFLVLVQLEFFVFVELVVLGRLRYGNRPGAVGEGLLLALRDIGRGHLGDRPVCPQRVAHALGPGDLHRVDPDRAPQLVNAGRAVGLGRAGRGLRRVALSGGLTGHEDLRKGLRERARHTLVGQGRVRRPWGATRSWFPDMPPCGRYPARRTSRPARPAAGSPV